MKVIACLPAHPRSENWPQAKMNRSTEPSRIALETGVGILMLTVPAGMFFDTSVPNVLWAVLDAPPAQLDTMGRFHDAAYRIDASWELADGSLRPITREAADDMAEAIARWSGASWLDGRKIRYGLGVGGGGSWHQKRLAWRPAP